MARFFRAQRTMCPRHAVLLIPPKSSHPSQFRSRQLSAPVTSLAATLMNLPASVANKRLAAGLTSLDATLTKKRGGGPCSEVRACQRCNAPFIHSFRSLRKECFTTPFDSQGSTLFLKTAGCTPTLPFLELPARLSPLYSSSFFSHSCVLFCAFLHARKTQLIYFQSLPHSWRKTPGVGEGASC